MPPSSFAELKAYRQTEDFKKLSESGKANRAKYAIDDKIPGTHNMGSISGVELAERMVRDDKDGTIPTAFQLFIKAHTHNGKLADKKAEEIKEKYETKKAQLEENGDEVNEDELFLEVVGGFQKGRLYGLGSAADYYFNKSAYSKTLSEPSSATSYIGTGVLSKVATATAKLLEENAKLKEENEKLKETTNARFQDSNEKMLKMQEELRVLSATCLQLSQFQRDSHEDGA